ncbi:tRNA-binding protein [Candidatus Frankia alpina]|uniref:tRNA-binding protein n=1 Tax=Candidatus Frankia alpina TaxID=2699483 RepID=A0A4S5EEY2_9ACTN|nr:tRNA-binding protein [Candidatus Frankia alpina]THJ70495.1 tRNA-binding protein [Candidatus Frankia alpina]
MDELPQKSQITFGKFQNVDLRVGRVLSAPLAEGTRHPCRVISLDLGHLGERRSVGQYALLAEEELVGQNVIACVNLGARDMGPYTSEALVLGVPHPEGPADQAQATPLFTTKDARPGDAVY